VSESKGKRIKLGQMLVAAGAIEPAQLTKALEEQKRNGGLLGMALVRLGFVDERAIVRALASQLNLPVVQLKGKQISSEVLELVPVDLVEKHRCLPLLVNEDGDARVLYLGMEDPSDPDVVAEICTLVGMNVQAVLVAPADLNDGIFRHYECAGGCVVSAAKFHVCAGDEFDRSERGRHGTDVPRRLWPRALVRGTGRAGLRGVGGPA